MKPVDPVKECIEFSQSLNTIQMQKFKKVAAHVRRTGDIGLFYLCAYCEPDPKKADCSIKETPLDDA